MTHILYMNVLELEARSVLHVNALIAGSQVADACICNF